MHALEGGDALRHLISVTEAEGVAHRGATPFKFPAAATYEPFRRSFLRVSIHSGTSQPERRMTLATERSAGMSSSVKSVMADPARPAEDKGRQVGRIGAHLWQLARTGAPRAANTVDIAHCGRWKVVVHNEAHALQRWAPRILSYGLELEASDVAAQ